MAIFASRSMPRQLSKSVRRPKITDKLSSFWHSSKSYPRLLNRPDNRRHPRPRRGALWRRLVRGAGSGACRSRVAPGPSGGHVPAGPALRPGCRMAANRPRLQAAAVSPAGQREKSLRPAAVAVRAGGPPRLRDPPPFAQSGCAGPEIVAAGAGEAPLLGLPGLAFHERPPPLRSGEGTEQREGTANPGAEPLAGTKRRARGLVSAFRQPPLARRPVF